MTLSRILSMSAQDDNTEYGFAEEALPLDALDVAENQAPPTRHLVIGNSTTTLCGLDRQPLKPSEVAHPSKAKKTDCPACRKANCIANKKVKAKVVEPAVVEPAVVEPAVVEPAVVEPVIVEPVVMIEVPLADTLEPNATINITPEAPVKVKKARTGGPKKFTPTVAEVAKVKQLRAAGLTLMGIEETMGWPDQHGCRASRIIKCQMLAGDE